MQQPNNMQQPHNMQQQPQNTVILKEPTCCGCCELRCGAIALIVWSFMCAINAFSITKPVSYHYAFNCVVGVLYLTAAMCGALALHLRTKIMGYVTAGCYGITSGGSAIIGILFIIASTQVNLIEVYGNTEGFQSITKESIRGILIGFAVLFFILSMLDAYFCYVWVQIGEYFDKNTGREAMIVQTIQQQAQPSPVQDASAAAML